MLDKFQTMRMALPHVGLGALSDTSIASTWGYDILVDKQINCVTEKRIYPVMEQEDLLARAPAQPVPLEQPKVDAKFARPEPQQVVLPEDHTHEFVLEWKEASEVAVAGEFNGWKPHFKLNREGKYWKGTTKIQKGSAPKKVQYKFVVDGTKWVLSHL